MKRLFLETSKASLRSKRSAKSVASAAVLALAVASTPQTRGWQSFTSPHNRPETVGNSKVLKEKSTKSFHFP